MWHDNFDSSQTAYIGTTKVWDNEVKISEWSIHVPGESEEKREGRKEEEKKEGKGEGKKAERSKGVRERGRRERRKKKGGMKERRM